MTTSAWKLDWIDYRIDEMPDYWSKAKRLILFCEKIDLLTSLWVAPSPDPKNNAIKDWVSERVCELEAKNDYLWPTHMSDEAYDQKVQDTYYNSCSRRLLRRMDAYETCEIGPYECEHSPSSINAECLKCERVICPNS
jgi:hypothetical protein